jgi:hypothetical protein
MTQQIHARCSAAETRVYPLFSTNVIDYAYGNRSVKSPDSSYVPDGITIPPAKAFPHSNPPCAFATVVFEIAHRNESWNQLISDARRKAFSLTTSIQVAIGIKIYTKKYRMFWRRRARSGNGMCIRKITPKLDMKTATRRVFNIPADLIFWGCPALPPLPSPMLPIRVETFRKAVEKVF